MAVDRKLLEQALQQGQDLTNRAIRGEGFDAKGGWGVAAAQIATAGIGAWAQNRAKKDLAEQETASQNAFAQQFPQYATLASQLSPETRQAYAVESFKNQLKASDPLEQAKLQKEQLGLASEKLNQQKIIAETNKLNKESSGKFIDPEKLFNNTSKLRGDYLTNSKEFQIVRSGYERVIESARNPSAAGDLALIFNYMKVLDPGSTVKEGEFATAEASRSIPQGVIARYHKLLRGERLGDQQRADFVDRASRLYARSEESHKKTVGQYSAIAKRNGINPEDVIIDFNSSIEQVPTQATTPPRQPLDPNAFKDLGNDAIAAEIARRGGQK